MKTDWFDQRLQSAREVSVRVTQPLKAAAELLLLSSRCFVGRYGSRRLVVVAVVVSSGFDRLVAVAVVVSSGFDRLVVFVALFSFVAGCVRWVPLSPKIHSRAMMYVDVLL